MCLAGGICAALVNVVSYAAPLASLQAVLREKSTALMPVEMCVGNFCCSALWLSYGWISEDSFIILPNFLGRQRPSLSAQGSAAQQLGGAGRLWERSERGFESVRFCVFRLLRRSGAAHALRSVSPSSASGLRGRSGQQQRWPRVFKCQSLRRKGSLSLGRTLGGAPFGFWDFCAAVQCLSCQTQD